MDTVKISKLLSYALRHNPDALSISLDKEGWTDVKQLLSNINKKGSRVTLDDLETVVKTSDKQRFAFNESKTKIRANQGHSVKVEIKFQEKTPPKVLFHGTTGKSLDAIYSTGLQKMKRHHVHLSDSIATAESVGARYGKPIILEIDALRMSDDGYKFYISDNGVWLTDNVPAQYIN
jgi:putative RNA 2'-phosphotransferase